tara:strand:- start:1649 stop:2656 length:1008 start_codon:yes stop_codon:yes gene_type:complete
MIFFRIDLGNERGLGHYQRIKSLINYLNIKKYKIIIDHLSDAKNLKNENNFEYLYPKKERFMDEKKDSKIFLNFVKKYSKKAVVIKDSYRLGYFWERAIYKYCKRLFIIDDFLNKKHYADIHINHSPNFHKIPENLIKTLKKNNKKKCKFLLGPEFSLFNSDPIKKKIKSDFVFYNGGSGNLNVYEKIIKNICRNKKYKIILIIGPFSKNFKILKSKFKKKENIKLLYNPENILNILSGTKVFISSAGISMFESSHLKIPTLLFKMNKNQNLSEFGYENLGHYFCLEKKDLKNVEKIAKLIKLMRENSNYIIEMMSKKGLNIDRIKNNYKKYLKF